MAEGPIHDPSMISTTSVRVEVPPKTRRRWNKAHGPLGDRSTWSKDNGDNDDHSPCATAAEAEGPISILPSPVGSMLWSFVEAVGSMIYPARVSDYAYDSVWKSAPRGTSLTYAVPVKRHDAYDADKIASIHRSLTECDLVRRWLPEAEVSSLKPVVAALVDVGHTGYLCINVENENRLIWLE